MKSKPILLSLGIVFILAVYNVNAQNNKKPNIIYIMSDDHTSQAIGAYGGRLAELNPTPNIDKLAKEGMLFENTFCTNSICTPSRATILTGQYSQTNGVLDLDGSLPPEKQYLPRELKKLGYSTAIIGKWHLKEEPAAFDYYEVLRSQGDYFNPVLRTTSKGKWPQNEVQYEGHSTDVITDRTLNYLKNRDKSKPFFLMHHYKAPHDMFEFAPRYADYLKDVEIPEPPSLYNQPYFGSEATVGKNGKLRPVIGTSVSERHIASNYVQKLLKDSVSGNLATHLAYQEYLKRYLRCVKGVDDNLGRLFAYLKKEGLWKNTVIIYTGDQGMMLGEHDFIDKRWMYEESMRMPFIVHYPQKIKTESRTDLLVNNTDFAPTVIELAGGKTPGYMQGKSFINTLNGKTEENWRETTYYRYWMHNIHHWVPAHFGIRSKRYKLIFYYAKHYLPESEWKNFYWEKKLRSLGYNTPVAWEFYDLKNDPKELRNRYNDPRYKTIISEMKSALKKQRSDLNETDKAYPEIQKIITDNWNK
ncbi:sulfatase family protein [Zobellia uliginosa]|uniref:sulfatase family protein n=1 Tax=Zobellia uliginosa TaxID=143224 RepID=UPI0026E19F38|nr:sulfatase [Zobellia uliginosa]MDO6518782.1 sulfatase [Zobellia uliginosa]